MGDVQEAQRVWWKRKVFDDGGGGVVDNGIEVEGWERDGDAP